MLMRDAIEETIDEATRRGIVDPKLHSAPLEAVRLLARKADVMSDNDNVTLPTLLKYMGALGIVVPPEAKPAKAEKPKPITKLDEMRGKRYGRRAG